MHLPPPFHPPRARSTCALVVELRRVPRFPRAIHPPYIAASTKGGFFRGFRLGGNRVIFPPLPVSLEFEEPVVVCRFSFWTMDVRGNTFFFFNFRFRRRFRRLIKKERENFARRFDEFSFSRGALLFLAIFLKRLSRFNDEWFRMIY